MISLIQGETANIEITVMDSEGVATLIGAEAYFAYGKDGATPVVKECTIEDDLIKLKLDPVDTLPLIGQYKYEVKIKDFSGNVDAVLTGRINVTKSMIPIV